MPAAIPPPPGGAGWSLARVYAWLVLLLLVLNAVTPHVLPAGQSTDPRTIALSPQDALAGRMALAYHHAGRPTDPLLDNVLSGSGDRRLAAAVFQIEVLGQQPVAALAGLSDRVEAPLLASARVYYGLPADEGAMTSTQLRVRLGWYGRLIGLRELPAEHSVRQELRAQADRLYQTQALLVGGALLLLAVGCVVAVQLGRAWFAGALLVRHHPEPDRDGAWLILGASLLLLFLFWNMMLGLLPLPARERLLLLPLFLLVLPVAWGMVRLTGRSHGAIATALGIQRGAGIMKEVCAGIAGWLAALPLVACALLLGLLLGGKQASHPIEAFSAEPFLLFLTAVGFAPLFEEFVFRGALLHHLRSRWPIPLAAGSSAALFALIHPQGPAGWPGLFVLGLTFALLRTWRGSLLAAWTAHTLHNAVLVTAMSLLYR